MFISTAGLKMGIRSIPIPNQGTDNHSTSETVTGTGTGSETEKEIDTAIKAEIELVDETGKIRRSRAMLKLNEQHEQSRVAVLTKGSNSPEGLENAALSTSKKEDDLPADEESTHVGHYEDVLLERGSALHVGAKARRMFLHAVALLR